MAFIPVPNVAQVNIRFEIAGQQIENVLNFNYALATDFSTAVPIIQDALEVWWATVRIQLSDQLVHIENYYVDLTSAIGPTATFGPFTPNDGDIAGDAVPNNAAFVVTHRTLARGRSFRGRTYMAGVAEGNVSLSRVGPTVVAAIVAAFNDLRTTLEADGISFVVVSRYSGGAPRVTGISTPIIATISRDDVIDSQRRRLPGRGR